MSSELRRRRVVAAVEAVSSFVETPAARRFARADLFTKPREEYQRQQSPIGAAVSVFVLAVIAVLLGYELIRYIVAWDAYTTELSVDLSPNPAHGGVPVHFDITLPQVQCQAMSIDVTDVSGKMELDVVHDLFKSPVDADGKLLFEGKYNYVLQRVRPDGVDAGSLAYDERRDPRSPKFCGICYIEPSAKHRRGTWDRPGGVLEQHASTVHKDMCCNTCEDVYRFYALHRLPRPNPADVEQCIDQMSRSSPGCNVKGTMTLRKVRSNVNIGPVHGPQLGPFGMHILTFNVNDLRRFNSSHRIVHFSLGDPNVRRFSKHGVHYALDGVDHTAHNVLTRTRYYLQVVPVSYESGRMRFDAGGLAPIPPTSYEFSVQKHEHAFRQLGNGNTPGISFTFDFHPIQVHNVFERRPLSQFLVKVCSIVGGVFVVSGFIDSLVSWVMRRLASRG